MRCSYKLVITLTLTLLLVSSAQAIGVSPTRISIDHAQRNSSIPVEVFLSGVPSQSKVHLAISGQAASWVTSERGDEFLFHSQHQMKIPLTISIPLDAPNGEYQARVRFSVSSSQGDDENNQVQLVSGVYLDMLIRVSGEQDMSFEIISAQLSTQSKDSPLELTMKINNKGNVQPELFIKLFAYDLRNKKLVFESQIRPIHNIPPFRTTLHTEFFDHNLTPSNYVFRIEVSDSSGLHKAFEQQLIIPDTSLDQPSVKILFLRSLYEDPQALITALVENVGTSRAVFVLHTSLQSQSQETITKTSEEFVLSAGQSEVITISIHDILPETYSVLAWLEYNGQFSNPSQSLLIVPKNLSSNNIIANFASTQFDIGNHTIHLGTISLFVLAVLLINGAVRVMIKKNKKNNSK